MFRGGEALGTAAIDGSAPAVKGMEYTLKTCMTTSSGYYYSTGNYRSKDEQELWLFAAVHSGAMLKASSAGGTLAGAEHSDIFANGEGNDFLTLSDGRGCAVYGTEAWGQDSIAATDGAMTLVFNGLSASDVTSSLAGSVMTFAKTSDASQTIAVSGWDSATHGVVFGGTMAAFDVWKSAASPSTDQIASARTEVWQKAGLASV